jgi:hypothetical protein
VTVSNSTISDNTADSGQSGSTAVGGGILNNHGSTVVISSIVW